MITVFGLGFVGLTTALGLAEMGHTVYGIEVNQDRYKTIKSGKLPFLEPGLDDALTRHLGDRFILTEDIESAIKESEYIYYCVGTPYGEGGEADLTYLFGAIEQTLSSIKDDKYRVLVTKSTIPPSTTSTKVIPFVEKKGWKVGQHFGVANNPEFLREGHCWEDFTNADRVVLGVSDEKSSHMLKQLYSENNRAPVFCVSLNTGEFIKYLSNTLLATLISYANEMSVVADTIGGIDTAEAFQILLMDKRWESGNMRYYAYPGCGYGGYCLPKDTNALYSLTKEQGYEPQILKNVIKVNDQMPQTIASRILQNVSLNQKIGILGLSFKPNSDDVRDSSSAKIIRSLLENGCSQIYVYDPVANMEFKKQYSEFDSIIYCKTFDEIIETTDALAIVTAWDEFKEIRSRTDKPVIDCRFML